MDQPISEESKDWIGTVEAGMVVDLLYNVPCKFVHCRDSDRVFAQVFNIFVTSFLKLSLGW